MAARPTEMSTAERVAYVTGAGERIRARWTHPGGGRFPGLLIVHDAGGPHAGLEDLADRFVREGFAALVPDLGRDALPDRRAVADLEAGLAWLAAREDVTALAVIGFGTGGTLAFLLGCTSRRLAAAVDFWGPTEYPELSAERPAQPLELALNLTCPVLFHFGTEDAAVPAVDIERLEDVLRQFATSYELESWEGAGSGFLWSGRPGYHEASARAAWDRTLRFLREQLEID